MKEKISNYFGDEVVYSSSTGKKTIVTLKNTVESIIRKCFSEVNTSDEDEKVRLIIEAAAKLIKSEIYSKQYPDKSSYPSADLVDINETLDFLPSSLKLYCNKMFVGVKKDRKVAAIGQAIVQATKPTKIISPLQIGLGIQMHLLFRSRFLIDTLNRLGFCSSYSEIEEFERNAALAGCSEINSAMENFGITEKEEEEEGTSCKPALIFAADKVDHCLRTLDGAGTFHGMGMIAMINNPNIIKRVVNLPRNRVPNEQLLQAASVNILEYKKKVYYFHL